MRVDFPDFTNKRLNKLASANRKELAYSLNMTFRHLLGAEQRWVSAYSASRSDLLDFSRSFFSSEVSICSSPHSRVRNRSGQSLNLIREVIWGGA